MEREPTFTPFFREKLGRIEELRVQDITANYETIDKRARALHAIAQMALKKNPLEIDYILASAGSANMVAGVNESAAKHILENPEEKMVALNKAHEWTLKIDEKEEYKQILRNTHITLHGPTVWISEKLRSLARIAERRPNASKLDQLASLGYSQLAVHEADQLLKEAVVSNNPELINAARSVKGTAQIEVARTLDTLLHLECSDISANTENDILQRINEGRDTVWQTRDIPNYDRLLAAEERVLHYLVTHKVAFTRPVFTKTVEHMLTLAKESPHVRERIVKRLQGFVNRTKMRVMPLLGFKTS